MLLTQTAAGSEVEETVQDTVDTITGFNKFIQEKGPDLIAFGIRILMALLIFIICHKVITGSARLRGHPWNAPIRIPVQDSLWILC